MAVLVTNNASTTLLAGVSSGDLTLTVPIGLGDLFPVIVAPDIAYLTLENAAGNIEIVKATARASGADSITVVRGQDGTSALAWLAGDALGLRPTAALINDIVADIVGKEDATNKGAANGYASLDASSKVQEVALQADTLTSVTADSTDLNRSDIATEGTVEASKVVTADSNKDIKELNNLDVVNIVDTNDNEVIKIGTTASAVNEITITNAATGNKPSINQTGAATNLGIDIEGVELKDGSLTSDNSITDTIVAKTAAALVTLDAGSSVTGKQQGHLVLLDEPVDVGASSATGTWASIDLTTFTSAAAKMAIIVTSSVTAGQLNVAEFTLYARKNGESAAVGNLTKKVKSYTIEVGAVIDTKAVGEFHVPLDSGQIFQFYQDAPGGTVDTSFAVVGYYV